MKTNKYAFPYPVLTNDQGNGADYADAGFQCTLDFSEEVDEDGNLKIEYCFELSNTEIQQLIDEGYAAFSLNIYCVETLFRTSEILQSEGVYKVPRPDYPSTPRANFHRICDNEAMWSIATKLHFRC